MRTLTSLLAMALGLLSSPACAAEDPPAAEGFVLVGGTVVGAGVRSVTVRGDSIVAVDPSPSEQSPPTRIDLTGRWLVPSVIDAHVHLAYLPKSDALARGGVAGAVDWAAPLTAIGGSSLRVAWAGPIITAVGGYPTQGWGRDGYGLEVADAGSAREAVAQVQAAGATVVKISVGAGGPELDDAALRAICEEAHARGMLVGAHALRDEHALRAGQVGADLLVHAPTGTLSPATVKAWAGKAVIPTVSAFGGLTSTRQLAEAGATVLYGTDFGNTRELGVSAEELAGMRSAGLDPAAILAATTSAPAQLFGFETLGAIAVGKEASLLVLDSDPLLDPSALARPVGVLWRGQFLVDPR